VKLLLAQREQLKHQKLRQFFKEYQKGQLRQDDKRFLRVSAFIVGVLLLLEADEAVGAVLGPGCRGRYLKRYLKMPSYSEKLLLSGKASMEISLSRSAEMGPGIA
jgi:hypothetical protein